MRTNMSKKNYTESIISKVTENHISARDIINRIIDSKNPDLTTTKEMPAVSMKDMVYGTKNSKDKKAPKDK